MPKSDRNRFESIRDKMTTILDRQAQSLTKFFGSASDRPYGTVRITGQKLAEWWQAQPPQVRVDYLKNASKEDWQEIIKVTGVGPGKGDSVGTTRQPQIYGVTQPQEGES